MHASMDSGSIYEDMIYELLLYYIRCKSAYPRFWSMLWSQVDSTNFCGQETATDHTTLHLHSYRVKSLLPIKSSTNQINVISWYLVSSFSSLFCQVLVKLRLRYIYILTNLKWLCTAFTQKWLMIIITPPYNCIYVYMNEALCA